MASVVAQQDVGDGRRGLVRDCEGKVKLPVSADRVTILAGNGGTHEVKGLLHRILQDQEGDN